MGVRRIRGVVLRNRSHKTNMLSLIRVHNIIFYVQQTFDGPCCEYGDQFDAKHWREGS